MSLAARAGVPLAWVGGFATLLWVLHLGLPQLAGLILQANEMTAASLGASLIELP